MMYDFLKKDGKIKKHYVEACTFLVSAQMQHRQTCTSRTSALLCDMKDDEIIEEYDAYSIPCDYFYSKDRTRLQNKVSHICRCFNIDPDYKYCLSSWVIVFKDQTEKYENMRDELLQLLRR